MMAARYANGDSNSTAVELLLQNGADVNKPDNEGWTPLMAAVRHANNDSNISAVKLLLRNGADVNRQNNNGWTPLMAAARYANNDSNISAVNILLQNGADVNRQNNNGWTALTLAAQNTNNESNIDTVKLLLQNGVDVSIKNNDDFTEYLSHNDLVECMKLVNHENKYVKIQKKLHDRCIKKIPIMSAKITDRPDTLRTDMIHVKWELDKNNKTIYDDAVKK